MDLSTQLDIWVCILGQGECLGFLEIFEMDLWMTHQYRSGMCAQVLSCVQLSATPWSVAHQASLSMRFSRQEYWSGFSFPAPGDLPNPGIKPCPLRWHCSLNKQLFIISRAIFSIQGCQPMLCYNYLLSHCSLFWHRLLVWCLWSLHFTPYVLTVSSCWIVRPLRIGIMAYSFLTSLQCFVST